MNRIINILFAWDCAIFSTVTLGKAYPGESFSSAAYRAEKYGMYFKVMRKPIDALFGLLGQKAHCQWAYEQAKFNLPEDMR